MKKPHSLLWLPLLVSCAISSLVISRANAQPDLSVIFIGQIGFLPIQTGVRAGCASTKPQFLIVVPPGVGLRDTVDSVAGGCAKAIIVDERPFPFVFYRWDGTRYAPLAVSLKVIPMGVWKPDVTYPRNAGIRFEGSVYISLQDDNLNQSPALTPFYWQLMPPDRIRGVAEPR